jgi:uncharacterized membrane protein YadS
MSVAIGTVFLLNAVALYLFPLLGHLLGLTQTQFGTWAGVAIHDTSSVVGAAAHYGLPALQTATAVKLSRVLWIAPVAFALALTSRRRLPPVAAVPGAIRPDSPASRPRIEVPWFVGLFLLATLVRSWVPGLAGVGAALANVAKPGFALTLFLIGAGLSRKTLRAVGWKPLAQGLLLWLFISVTSLLIILTQRA